MEELRLYNQARSSRVVSIGYIFVQALTKGTPVSRVEFPGELGRRLDDEFNPPWSKHRLSFLPGEIALYIERNLKEGAL